MFEAEVARGIALLDERVPGWRDKIDVDRLDMVWASERATRDNRCCIGAQLADPTDAEDYYDWASQLSGYDSIDQHDDFEEWAYRHGFEAPLGRYPTLTEAWKRALIEPDRDDLHGQAVGEADPDPDPTPEIPPPPCPHDPPCGETFAEADQ